MTVLVVEDQSNLAEPLQDLLEAQGHGCLTACDVDEAEWILQAVRVEVLVLDLEVPGRGAREWLEDLCLARPELARSTVAISGSPAAADEALVVRACGASLLRKPFAIQELHEAVLERVRKVILPATVEQPIEVGERPELDESEEH